MNRFQNVRRGDILSTTTDRCVVGSGTSAANFAPGLYICSGPDSRDSLSSSWLPKLESATTHLRACRVCTNDSQFLALRYCWTRPVSGSNPRGLSSSPYPKCQEMGLATSCVAENSGSPRDSLGYLRRQFCARTIYMFRPGILRFSPPDSPGWRV